MQPKTAALQHFLYRVRQQSSWFLEQNTPLYYSVIILFKTPEPDFVYEVRRNLVLPLKYIEGGKCVKDFYSNFSMKIIFIMIEELVMKRNFHFLVYIMNKESFYILILLSIWIDERKCLCAFRSQLLNWLIKLFKKLVLLKFFFFFELGLILNMDLKPKNLTANSTL